MLANKVQNYTAIDVTRRFASRNSKVIQIYFSHPFTVCSPPEL
jgi:hypothetical protein